MDVVAAKHRKTLERVFETPTHASVRWPGVAALIAALGGTLEEGAGSRVRIRLNGRRAVFHKPHPKPEMDKGAVVSLRVFLKEAGETP
ncbi:MAG: type II toxin-antitoxin system HicA family toxin [Pseudomonadota bacterium]